MTISWKALAFALTLSLAGCGEGDPKGATNPAGTAGAGGTLTETSTTGGLGGSDTTGGTSGTGGALGDAGEMYDASMDDGTSAGDGSLSDQASGRDAGPSLSRVTLFAGGGMGGDGVQATQSKVAQPFSVARDPLTGFFYISEYQGNRIRRVDAAGVTNLITSAFRPAVATCLSATRSTAASFASTSRRAPSLLLPRMQASARPSASRSIPKASAFTWRTPTTIGYARSISRRRW